MISGRPRTTRSSCTTRRRGTRLRFAVPFVLSVLPSLSNPASKTPAPPPAWPPPPSEARIVYVREISSPVDIGVKPSFLVRLGDWVSGNTRAKERLQKPFGLCLDDSGRLLVTDTGANAVCRFDFARKKWTRWESVGKTRFKSPVAVAAFGQTIFAADSALGKVIAFDEKGKPRFEITKELTRPSGLARLGEKLYIADSQLHQVVVCDLRGQFVSKFGHRGGGLGEFNFPTHVSAVGAYQICVTDSLNNRIQIFDANGKFLRAFGTVGDSPGTFSRPKGVAPDRDGHLHVVDAVFDNVQVFDGQSRLLLNWGENGSGPGQFWLPNAIVISRADEIYVADSYNHRIQVFRYLGKP